MAGGIFLGPDRTEEIEKRKVVEESRLPRSRTSGEAGGALPYGLRRGASLARARAKAEALLLDEADGGDEHERGDRPVHLDIHEEGGRPILLIEHDPRGEASAPVRVIDFGVKISKGSRGGAGARTSSRRTSAGRRLPREIEARGPEKSPKKHARSQSSRCNAETFGHRRSRCARKKEVGIWQEVSGRSTRHVK